MKLKMIGKSVCLLAFLITIAAVANCEPIANSYADSNSHHLTVGRREAGDRLVLRQNVIKESKWLQIVKVEQLFSVSKYERITLVQAFDQKTNGNGAYASLLNGGPASSNVTLKFKSQRGHGINFVVELYARP